MRQAEETAQWAAGKPIHVAQIRHSGKLRAEQTAQIIGKNLAPPQGIIQTAGLNPDDELQPILDELEAEGLSSIMLVGHNPFMGILVHHLLSGNSKNRSPTFHTGTIACLKKSGPNWTLTDTFTPFI
ncbi:MAG TPA: phosphohistidine phosphatase SixA [Nitrospiria bacterium]